MKKLSWIFLALLILVLALAGVFLSVQSSRSEVDVESTLTEEQIESAEASAEAALNPIALPEIVPTESATESVPELNPVKKTNPFAGGYKNPFGSN